MVMPPEEARGVIDEYPALAVAAASAARGTRLCDLAKRRVQQGAQHAATVALLHATEVPVRVDDDMIVNGGHADDLGGRLVQAPTLHRLATGTVMMGLAARSPIEMGDLGVVGPMNRLGTGPAERGA